MTDPERLAATPIFDGVEPMPEARKPQRTSTTIVSYTAIVAYVFLTNGAERLDALPLSTDLTYGPAEAGLITMAVYLFGIVVASFIHECGHAVAGTLFRYRFVSLDVMGFGVARMSGRLRFRHAPQNGSVTLMVPPLDCGRRDRFAFFTGGIVANAATAVLAVALPPSLVGPIPDFVLWVVGGISCAMAFTNLIPARARRNASDGAQLVDTIEGGVRYRRSLALLRIVRRLEDGAAADTIADADLDEIRAPEDVSLEEMRANLVLYAARVERHRSECARYIERALRSTTYATPAERSTIAIEAAMYAGWYCGDADGFKRWYDIAMAGETMPLGRLRLEIVAAFIRGDYALALETIDRVIPLVDKAVSAAQRETFRRALTRWRAEIAALAVGAVTER